MGTHMCFLAFSHQYLTQLFFPKPLTTFLICFCRGERQKYAGKKSRLNRGSKSQPPGHESDMLTTKPPGRVPPRWAQPVTDLHFMAEWCFKSILTVYQSHHSDCSHYSCLMGITNTRLGLWSVLP